MKSFLAKNRHAHLKYTSLLPLFSTNSSSLVSNSRALNSTKNPILKVSTQNVSQPNQHLHYVTFLVFLIAGISDQNVRAWNVSRGVCQGQAGALTLGDSCSLVHANGLQVGGCDDTHSKWANGEFQKLLANWLGWYTNQSRSVHILVFFAVVYFPCADAWDLSRCE